MPDEVHRAIHARALQRGHSAEAEMREIIEFATRPSGRVKLGSLLAEVGRTVGMTEEEFALFEQSSDKAEARSANFE